MIQFQDRTFDFQYANAKPNQFYFGFDSKLLIFLTAELKILVKLLLEV